MYEHGFSPDDSDAYPTLDITEWRDAGNLLSDGPGADSYISLDIIPDQYSDFNVVAEPESDNAPAEQIDYVSVWQRPCEEWNTTDTDYLYTNPAKNVPFVKNAQTIQEQLASPVYGTETTIDYWQSTSLTRELFTDLNNPMNAEMATITEREALMQLDKFLSTAHQELADADDEYLRSLSDQAAWIRQNLHYIDKTVFEEATAGIAGLWTGYLADDSRNQIYVPQGVIRSGSTTTKKSSERVFHAVHGKLDEYLRQQVVTSARRVRSPQWTKTILLDDWSKSGAQLENGYQKISAKHGGWHALHSLTRNMEVHLLAASDAQLLDPGITGAEQQFPTYAYLHAGPDIANNPYDGRNGPVITGAHSAVDFHFELNIREMADALRVLHPGQDIYLPPPCNIVRR